MRLKVQQHMLEAIEKLLILQDRDQGIFRVKNQLAHVDPERQMALNARASGTQASLEAAKTRVKHLESDRKKLELDGERPRSRTSKSTPCSNFRPRRTRNTVR